MKNKADNFFLNGNYESALQIYARLIQDNPNDVEILTKFSVCLIKLHEYEYAQQIIEEILKLNPSHLPAHINLCTVYQATNRNSEQLACAMKAVELHPGNYVAYNNLGTALGELHRDNDAIEAYKISLAINPTYFETWVNLGQLLVRSYNNDEAIKIFNRILADKNIKNKNSNLVKYYMSFAMLQRGDLKTGWKYYEYGLNENLPLNSIRAISKFKLPIWNGKKTENNKLLIYREQGIGDELEFSTCLDDVIKAGMDITYVTEKRLVEIFAATYPEIKVISEVEVHSNPIVENANHFQIAVGSLPKIYMNDKISIRNREFRNLKVNKDSYDEIQKKIGPKSNNRKLRIGISWRSGLLNVQRNRNYTSLIDWSPFVHDEVELYNLQYGDISEEIEEFENKFKVKIKVIEGMDYRNDFKSLIALINNLDGVVSVGTAVSSIAARCGIPVYLLQRYNWMCLGEHEEYLWYQNVKVYNELKDTYSIAHLLPRIFNDVLHDLMKA